MDDTLVAVLYRHRDEALPGERIHVGANLPIAHAKKVGKVSVGSKTTALVVEAVDLNEDHFLHERKRRREPNLSGNPDAFEVSLGALHVIHFTAREAISPNRVFHRRVRASDLPAALVV